MKKNVKEEVILKAENKQNQVSNEVKASKKEKKNKKVKDSKEEKPKKEKKSKEVVLKKELTKEVAKQQKVNIMEEVIAHRQVKYKYPDDVVDTLARKTWRQKTRNELHRLELALSRIKDQNSKEWKKANKEYESFKDQVLKPEQIA
jgi:PREDICTED: microtubule-associated protein 1B